MYLVRKMKCTTDLRKKALRKFECLSLRNEINVTNGWKSFSVGKSYSAWLCTNVVTDFILDKHSNF